MGGWGPGEIPFTGICASVTTNSIIQHLPSTPTCPALHTKIQILSLNCHKRQVEKKSFINRVLCVFLPGDNLSFPGTCRPASLFTFPLTPNGSFKTCPSLSLSSPNHNFSLRTHFGDMIFFNSGCLCRT